MPLAPHTLDTRFRYAPLFTNHGDTESTEGTIFLARSGDPPASPERLAMAGRRRSGKRSQPCGHDLVNGWIQAKELSSEAEALFPGRRLPAREKTISSVISVPLW
jgi:hypothetical protein